MLITSEKDGNPCLLFLLSELCRYVNTELDLSTRLLTCGEGLPLCWQVGALAVRLVLDALSARLFLCPLGEIA